MKTEQTIQLSLNNTAPKFKLIDIFGRAIALEEYRGKKVFLGFFRHAGCPFCNLRVHALSGIHRELQALNLEMIFFFESKESTLLRSTFHREVSPIPIISDSEKIWYHAYGLEESLGKTTVSHLTSFLATAIKAKQAKVPVHLMSDKESFSTLPAEFLIDEQGIIRELRYAQHLNDRMSLEAIKEFAKGEKK